MCAAGFRQTGVSAMLTVSRRQIRWACIALACLYVLAFVLRWATYEGYLGRVARNAGMWNHQGLFLPIWLLALLGFAWLATFILGLVGTALFRYWGRLLLALAFLLAVIVAPLRGEVVLSPLSAFVGGLLGTLHVWLITVMYWSLASKEFDGHASSSAAAS
jgi:hypothetical protein